MSNNLNDTFNIKLQNKTDMPLTDFQHASNWFNGTLSINEQRTFAKKHLDEVQHTCFTSYFKYVSNKYYQECIIQIWQKEGSPIVEPYK
jgi:hypothetical protein